MGSPLSYHTLIFDLMSSRNMYLYNAYIYTYILIDDVFSLNNHKFSDYFYDIYPVELEIKETTDDQYHSSFLDLLLEIDKDGRLRVKIYDKRDDFNFDIVNFPFLCGNVPQSPSYGVYISRLRVIIPTAHNSDDPLFRQPIIPTAHCSDSPLFRRPIIPITNTYIHTF